MTDSGVCRIKPEFIVKNHTPEVTWNCISEKDVQLLLGDDSTEPCTKRQRLSKAQKKKLRGQNKSRPTFRCDKKKELCVSILKDEPQKCSKKNCLYIHDIQEYLKIKPKDIGECCFNFEVAGYCNRGVTCRFGSKHITSDGKNQINNEKFEAYKSSGPHTVNILSFELQQALRKRTYDFSLSEALIRYNDNLYGTKKEESIDKTTNSSKTSGCITDEDIIKLKNREKKQVNWKDKLFLSPLTTVGNLPFRRICKEFGADVTCGEMAMCSSLLRQSPQEWALMRRHHSEDIFGVQLCANNPHLLAKCGQLINEHIEVDFVDLNLGCPIVTVCAEGAGCGLLRRKRTLEFCVRNLCDILSVPLTLKTRIGVYTDENVAHQLVPKFREWGATLVTVHGRSREQRYTKMADWEYIEQCAKLSAPMPIIGNGDVLSYDDYKFIKETYPELTGVMIGRGALIKPWIFTEIKEKKLWDISSSERFDILKKYANYGLEHWGSDSKGVENTRRFMLEWLSFLHRYVPVGLLETPPQKINERPPRFNGRNDLETLMGSSAACDWIKLSEMLLGPVPENFKFLPKHKANSYK